MWAPRVEEIEALQVETRYFLDCVTTGKTPFNDGRAGLRVVKILEAAEESLKRCKEVAYTAAG
jgi:predicted dehydrogenase